VALVAGALAGGVNPAGAGPVDGKQAQAARLAAQLDAGAHRIAGLAARLAGAKAQLATTDAALAQAAGMLGAADRNYDELRSRLARQAVNAYVHGGAVGLVEELAHSRGADLSLRNQYASLAAGTDRAVADELVAAREDLRLRRASLERLRSDRRSGVAALAAEQAALLRAEAAEQALFARVKGELAALVAAEQARRDARARRPRGGPGGPWDCIRQLESGNNYSAPGGGAYQFQDSTWHALGHSGTASDASPQEQDAAAVQLQQQAGWDQWTTAKRCGR
jgi:chromosome segregation ATPase